MQLSCVCQELQKQTVDNPTTEFIPRIFERLRINKKRSQRDHFQFSTPFQKEPKNFEPDENSRFKHPAPSNEKNV